MKKAIFVSIVSISLLSALAYFYASKKEKHWANVTLLYQGNRMGALEPCGCEMAPYGGIDREANAVQHFRSQRKGVFYVDSGNLFVPPTLQGGLDHNYKKAQAIVTMLNTTNLDAFSPGPTDYQLGLEHLKELEKKANFPFISSNVVDDSGKNIFKPYAIKQRNGVKIAFLSLTPDTLKISGIKVLSPEETIQKWGTELKQKADMVVVLSQFDAKKNEKLTQVLKPIDIMVSTDVEFSTEDPFWMDGRLMVDTHRQGFYLGKLEMHLEKPNKGFYSDKLIAKNRKELSVWTNELKKDPKNKLNHKMIDILNERHLFPIQGGSPIEHELLALDIKRFGDKNLVTELKQKFNKSLRDAALSE